MKTIKIQVMETTTTKKEVEFEIPCFRKDGVRYYKVLDENKAIEVVLFKAYNDYILQSNTAESAFRDGSEPCTEEEFNTAFATAIKNLSI
jgi:glutamate mutase epsilon subunit